MTSTRKRILITGGARRVGRRLVEHLSAAGHGIVIHANSNFAEAEQLCAKLRLSNQDTWAISANLADPAAAHVLIDQAAHLAGGPLSGLINSASVFDYDTPEDLKTDVFDLAMAVNLRAPALLSKRFAAQAGLACDNCIINLLDQKLWNMNPDFFSYTLSKAGLLAATDMMARAFAPHVRVNAIAPGLLLPSFDQTQAEFEEVASRNPIGRPIDLANLMSAASFLLDNTALTAQVIHLDNGQRLEASPRDVMFDRHPDGSNQ